MADAKEPVELERCDPEAEKLFRAIKSGTVHEVVSKVNENPLLLKLQDGCGRAALHFAAYFGRLDVLEALIRCEHRVHIETDLEDFDGNTPLVLAVKQRDARVSDFLIKHAGADVKKCLKHKSTALHHAACVANNVAVLKVLIQNGALENETVLNEATHGGTPLHWACHCNDILNPSFFLDELSVDVNVTDEHGGTPLFVATFLKNVEVVRFLLERGANALHLANDQSTPLSTAINEAKDPEIVRHMLTFCDEEKLDRSKLHSDIKEIQAEIDRKQPTEAANKELCERFKKQGNNVFGEGQFMKAIRFYTLSITHDPRNHALFSNRSACYFNLGQHRRALTDARHCVRLAPEWVKGYYRAAAALYELSEYETCSDLCKRGLLLDGTYQDLKQVYERCQKKIASIRSASLKE